MASLGSCDGFLNVVRYSPTAYNVFKAYTIRSEYLSGGSCIRVTNPPFTLTSAYTETIAEASGAVYLNAEGQQSFLEFLDLTSCSAGGENVRPTVVVNVHNTTAETTRYQTGAALAPALRTLGRVSCSTFVGLSASASRFLLPRWLEQFLFHGMLKAAWTRNHTTGS